MSYDEMRLVYPGQTVPVVRVAGPSGRTGERRLSGTSADVVLWDDTAGTFVVFNVSPERFVALRDVIKQFDADQLATLGVLAGEWHGSAEQLVATARLLS